MTIKYIENYSYDTDFERQTVDFARAIILIGLVIGSGMWLGLVIIDKF